MVKNNFLKDIEEVQDTAFRVSLKIVKNPAEVEIKAWYLKIVINSSLNLYKKKKNAKNHSQRVCIHKKGLKDKSDNDSQQLLKEL